MYMHVCSRYCVQERRWKIEVGGRGREGRVVEGCKCACIYAEMMTYHITQQTYSSSVLAPCTHFPSRVFPAACTYTIEAREWGREEWRNEYIHRQRKRKGNGWLYSRAIPSHQITGVLVLQLSVMYYEGGGIIKFSRVNIERQKWKWNLNVNKYHN